VRRERKDNRIPGTALKNRERVKGSLMKPLRLFLLLTFVFFFVGFGITGVLFAVGSPNFLVVIVQVLMAWTPTLAFAIIHRQVEPDRSLWRSVAARFSTPLKVPLLAAAVLIPVVATVIVGVVYSGISHRAFFDLTAKLSAGSILLIFLDGLIRGPLGEELGWRGYLQLELNKRFPVLKSSLLVGLIWGVWHLPLWFVSGFSGTHLLLYVVFFMAGLVSFSVITGYLYGNTSFLRT
jgi:membrane protease YdiL (CAAX protease family)